MDRSSIGRAPAGCSCRAEAVMRPGPRRSAAPLRPPGADDLPSLLASSRFAEGGAGDPFTPYASKGRNSMSTYVITHEVNDVEHWLSSPKREEVFGPMGI